MLGSGEKADRLGPEDPGYDVVVRALGFGDSEVPVARMMRGPLEADLSVKGPGKGCSGDKAF